MGDGNGILGGKKKETAIFYWVTREVRGSLIYGMIGYSGKTSHQRDELNLGNKDRPMKRVYLISYI